MRPARRLPPLVAAALLAGCTSLVWHERGLPKRVEVRKEASAPRRALAAERLGPGRVAVLVLAQREVRLRRRVVYNAIETRAEWNPNPAWELLEVPYGLALLPLLPFIWGFGLLDFHDDATMRANTTRNKLAFAFGFINPAQSIVAAQLVRDPNVDRELFFSPTQTTTYAVALPARGVGVRYRILDPAGATLAAGEARSDAFGRIVIAGLPEVTVTVEASSGPARLRAVLRAAAAPPR